MIDLYMIINGDTAIETYIRDKNKKRKRQMYAIINHVFKTAKPGDSKIIRNIKVGTYYVYYFKQQPFIFLLATQLQNKVLRMQNYLRVVADIFYDNYDEKKFHYVLDRIMGQINKAEFGARKQPGTLEDEESMLVQPTVLQEKMKISKYVQDKNRHSVRAYVIIVILFLSILVLACIYLGKNFS